MDDAKSNTFQTLLNYLNPDEQVASDKYLVLHFKLAKTLIWKGCRQTDAESVADEILERVGRKIETIEQKLSQGVTEENGKEIRRIEDINAYSFKVLHFVLLEYFHQNPLPPDEDPPEIPVEPSMEIFEEPELGVRCLRKCLAEEITNETDKELILGYYNQNESEEKNKVVREKLRTKLGLSKSNFKKKACLLRQKLKKCVNNCLGKLTVTKTSNSDTIVKEAF